MHTARTRIDTHTRAHVLARTLEHTHAQTRTHTDTHAHAGHWGFNVDYPPPKGNVWKGAFVVVETVKEF